MRPRLLAGVLIAVAFLAAGVMFLLDAREGGAPTTPPSRAPTPLRGSDPSPAPGAGSGLPEALEVLVADPVALPFELALIDNGIRRIFRDASGETVVETLLDPAAVGSVITYWNIGYLGPSLPAGQIAISVCTTGDCGGHDRASPDARTTIYRSFDGGISWHAEEALDGVFQIASALDPERLLLRRFGRAGEDDAPHYRWWPSAEAVEAPEEAWAEREPQVLADGRVAWWTADGRLIDGDGGLLIDLSDELGEGAAASGLAALPRWHGDRLAVTWEATDAAHPRGVRYWSIYEASDGAFVLVRTFEAVPGTVPAAWIDAGRLLVNVDLDGSRRLPAILHLESATLFPLEVGRDGAGLGRLWAVAAQVGPFGYVDAGEGDCLNLRTGSSGLAERLECLPHGTLVRRLASPVEGWTRVRAPSGAEGWVSAEFLVELVDETLLGMDDPMAQVYRALRLAEGWEPECAPGDPCLFDAGFDRNVEAALDLCRRTDPASFRGAEGYDDWLHERRIADAERACALLEETRTRLGAPSGDDLAWRVAADTAANGLEPHYGTGAGLAPPRPLR